MHSSLWRFGSDNGVCFRAVYSYNMLYNMEEGCGDFLGVLAEACTMQVFVGLSCTASNGRMSVCIGWKVSLDTLRQGI